MILAELVTIPSHKAAGGAVRAAVRAFRNVCAGPERRGWGAKIAARPNVNPPPTFACDF
jgi:hypothetical protein